MLKNKSAIITGSTSSIGKNMDIDDVVLNVILAAQPTKKNVIFDELNARTLFLAGDNAASINGASISIDGGGPAQ